MNSSTPKKSQPRAGASIGASEHPGYQAQGNTNILQGEKELPVKGNHNPTNAEATYSMARWMSEGKSEEHWHTANLGGSGGWHKLHKWSLDLENGSTRDHQTYRNML